MRSIKNMPKGGEEQKRALCKEFKELIKKGGEDVELPDDDKDLLKWVGTDGRCLRLLLKKSDLEIEEKTHLLNIQCDLRFMDDNGKTIFYASKVKLKEADT